MNIVKQIFCAAADADVIPKDPSRKLKPGGKRPEQRQALTEDQQAALLSAVRGLKVETMVMLGLYTGMRRGEICGLRWDSVHLDGETPYIEVRRGCRWPDNLRAEVTGELKTPAAYRSIPIPPQLLDLLCCLGYILIRRHLQGAPHRGNVIRTNGKPRQINAVFSR